jgi:CTP-dependent riboflavin kinase
MNPVFISEEIAKALNQYLGSQPFDNIANLVIAYRQAVLPQLQKIEQLRQEQAQQPQEPQASAQESQPASQPANPS